MGFKKSAVPSTVRVAFTVELEVEGKDLERAEVVHVFNRPTVQQREKHKQIMSYFEGGKFKPRVTAANAWLWDQCIQKVEGYDDLPTGDFREYFSDDIGREHKSAATGLLLEHLNENESDLAKKLGE